MNDKKRWGAPRTVRGRKFRRGDTLTLAEVVACLDAGEWVFMRDRPVHPSWVGSMQFNTICGTARRGDFRRALRNETAPCS